MSIPVCIGRRSTVSDGKSRVQTSATDDTNVGCTQNNNIECVKCVEGDSTNRKKFNMQRAVSKRVQTFDIYDAFSDKLAKKKTTSESSKTRTCIRSESVSSAEKKVKSSVQPKTKEAVVKKGKKKTTVLTKVHKNKVKLKKDDDKNVSVTETNVSGITKKSMTDSNLITIILDENDNEKSDLDNKGGAKSKKTDKKSVNKAKVKKTIIKRRKFEIKQNLKETSNTSANGTEKPATQSDTCDKSTEKQITTYSALNKDKVNTCSSVRNLHAKRKRSRSFSSHSNKYSSSSIRYRSKRSYSRDSERSYSRNSYRSSQSYSKEQYRGSYSRDRYRESYSRERYRNCRSHSRGRYLHRRSSSKENFRRRRSSSKDTFRSSSSDSQCLHSRSRSRRRRPDSRFRYARSSRSRPSYSDSSSSRSFTSYSPTSDVKSCNRFSYFDNIDKYHVAREVFDNEYHRDYGYFPLHDYPYTDPYYTKHRYYVHSDNRSRYSRSYSRSRSRSHYRSMSSSSFTESSSSCNSSPSRSSKQDSNARSSHNRHRKCSVSRCPSRKTSVHNTECKLKIPKSYDFKHLPTNDVKTELKSNTDVSRKPQNLRCNEMNMESKEFRNNALCAVKTKPKTKNRVIVSKKNKKMLNKSPTSGPSVAIATSKPKVITSLQPSVATTISLPLVISISDSDETTDVPNEINSTTGSISRASILNADQTHVNDRSVPRTSSKYDCSIKTVDLQPADSNECSCQPNTVHRIVTLTSIDSEQNLSKACKQKGAYTTTMKLNTCKTQNTHGKVKVKLTNKLPQVFHIDRSKNKTTRPQPNRPQKKRAKYTAEQLRLLMEIGLYLQNIFKEVSEQIDRKKSL
ncbi:unnamed protein product [Mytilus coruscus]|uniref:Uncharacterized protein n=1 Tax=Mytilus coruscus TaxID=42192 RepID=A0A6J8ADR7_MYTCO|nr:unnamed protein product [Mytilus coruscus]